MFNRVAIVGLGLIGNSIGLALHNANAAQQILGYDPNKGMANRARKIGAIDKLVPNWLMQCVALNSLL